MEGMKNMSKYLNSKGIVNTISNSSLRINGTSPHNSKFTITYHPTLKIRPRKLLHRQTVLSIAGLTFHPLNNRGLFDVISTH